MNLLESIAHSISLGYKVDFESRMGHNYITCTSKEGHVI